MRKLKFANKENSILKAVCAGILGAAVVTLFFSAIAGIFIESEYLDIQSVAIMAAIIQGISVFAGALIAGKMTLEKKMLSCILVSACYYLTLFGLALLFFEGVTGSAIYGFFVCLLSAFLAIMVCSRKNKHVSASKRRKRYC